MSYKIKTNSKDILKRILIDIKDFYIAIFLLIIYNIVVRRIFNAFCPQLIFTGFPCAGCGMTRAMVCIMTGQFARGLRLNPAAPLWLLFFVWFFINRYILGKRSKHTYMFVGIVAVVTLVIYIYRMLNCFPGEPPMVYNEKNILRYLLHYHVSL